MKEITNKWYFWVAVGVAAVLAYNYFTKKDESSTTTTTTTPATTTK